MDRHPTIAITGTISIRKFGDSSYIFWTNNAPVVEVNIRGSEHDIVFVNWVGKAQCSDIALLAYIRQYEDRCPA